MTLALSVGPAADRLDRIVDQVDLEVGDLVDRVVDRVDRPGPFSRFFLYIPFIVEFDLGVWLPRGPGADLDQVDREGFGDDVDLFGDDRFQVGFPDLFLHVGQLFEAGKRLFQVLFGERVTHILQFIGKSVPAGVFSPGPAGFRSGRYLRGA